MNTSAIASFLKENVGPFRDFSAERLQSLVEGSRVGSFEASEVIVHQGDEATHFGVVLSGTVHASALGDGGMQQSLGQLKAGDTFNEMALMTGDAVLADFIAESRCEVLLIPVSLFQSVIVAEPGAVQHISRTIAERMKSILADPQKAAAALRQGDDPYGLKLKGERPEKILVINCGSSSLKYSFYDTADESRHARGQVERIGIDGTRLAHRGPKGEVKRELPKGGFAEAFKAMIAELTAKETGVISGAGEVSVVAHRVVHGGEKFTEGNAHHRRGAGADRSAQPARAAAQPGERRRHSRDAAAVPGRAARRGLRHGVSPHAAGLRVSLRPALRALREEGACAATASTARRTTTSACAPRSF